MSLASADTALDTLLTCTGYMIWREAAKTQPLFEDPVLSFSDCHLAKGLAFGYLVAGAVVIDAMFYTTRPCGFFLRDPTAVRGRVGSKYSSEFGFRFGERSSFALLAMATYPVAVCCDDSCRNIWVVFLPCLALDHRREFVKRGVGIVVISCIVHYFFFPFTP